MKTEKRIMPNGNYESVVLYIQHDCMDYNQEIRCRQYSNKMDKLELVIGNGYCCDDHGGCEHKVEVNFCPICGYHSEKDGCSHDFIRQLKMDGSLSHPFCSKCGIVESCV